VCVCVCVIVCVWVCDSTRVVHDKLYSTVLHWVAHK